MAECYSIFALRLNTLTLNHHFCDLSTIRLRLQRFVIRLEEESRIGTRFAEVWLKHFFHCAVWPDVAICRHFSDFQNALGIYFSENRQKMEVWCRCLGVCKIYFIIVATNLSIFSSEHLVTLVVQVEKRKLTVASTSIKSFFNLYIRPRWASSRTVTSSPSRLACSSQRLTIKLELRRSESKTFETMKSETLKAIKGAEPSSKNWKRFKQTA